MTDTGLLGIDSVESIVGEVEGTVQVCRKS